MRHRKARRRRGPNVSGEHQRPKAQHSARPSQDLLVNRSRNVRDVARTVGASPN